MLLLDGDECCCGVEMSVVVGWRSGLMLGADNY